MRFVEQLRGIAVVGVGIGGQRLTLMIVERFRRALGETDIVLAAYRHWSSLHAWRFGGDGMRLHLARPLAQQPKERAAARLLCGAWTARYPLLAAGRALLLHVAQLPSAVSEVN